MKKKNWIIFIFFNCLLLLIFSNQLKAQCNYRVIGINNDTTSYIIPSGFPIIQNTGDSLTDINNYMQSLTSWNNNPATSSTVFLPTPVITDVAKIYIEVSSATFSLFDMDRKNKILANPQLYKIL